MNSLNWLLPIVLTVLTTLSLLVYEALRGPRRQARVASAIAGGGLAVALYTTLLLLRRVLLEPIPGGIFHGQLQPDPFAYLVMTIILGGALLTLMIPRLADTERDLAARDFHALLLLATAGLCLLTLASCYLTLLFGLEIASLALYALAGLAVRESRSREAALKYFLMGAFASALLVFGIALVFAQQGSFLFAETAKRAADPTTVTPGLFSGLALILAGLFFKVSVVPFHGWTPDTYEGAPTPVTAFMSVAVKAAGLALLFRLLFVAFRPLVGDTLPLLSLLALVTMTLANFAALAQSGVKRLLAWSTVSHVGYLLVGFTAAAAGSAHLAGDRYGAGSGLLFYLVAYTLMNMGAFAVVLAFERPGEILRVDDLGGMARRHPLLAAALSLFLLSLAGIPPLAGFMGKFALFYAAARAGFLGLVLAAVLNSLLSVYYYLRLIFALYSGPDAGRQAVLDPPRILAILLAVCGVLALGIFPGPLLSFGKLVMLRSF